MKEQFKYIKQYPTIEVSNTGKFRHKAVKAYKGDELVEIPPLYIEPTFCEDGKVLISLPRLTRDNKMIRTEENALSLLLDTFVRTGVPMSRVEFKDGDYTNLQLTNIKIRR